MRALKVLYITYLGLMEPIPKSQVTPYLIKLSKDVDIYLLSFEKKSLLKEHPKELESLKSNLKKNGIIWFMIKYHKKPLILSSFYDVFKGLIISFYLIYKHKITIVHARSNIPIVIGFFLKIFTKIKLIYDRRGIMGEDHLEHSNWAKGGILHRLSVRFEKAVIKRSDAIVVLTEWMNKYLQKNFRFAEKANIKTIPCCVDLELFKNNNGKDGELVERYGLKDKFVFIYAGSLGTYNLLKEMLDFFITAKKEIPNAHFLILTHTSDRVLNSIEEKIPYENFTITYAERKKLPRFYSIGDAGLVFRRPSITARASSPTKFSEYMAMGLPVVAGPEIGDLDEVINSNRVGSVLKNYSGAEYKKTVLDIIGLLKEKEELKKRCRDLSKTYFSLEEGSREYLSIYSLL
jgi:glycosyltransferase involved in cell wall biosynthesis